MTGNKLIKWRVQILGHLGAKRSLHVPTLELPSLSPNYMTPAINFSFSWVRRFSDLSVAISGETASPAWWPKQQAEFSHPWPSCKPKTKHWRPAQTFGLPAHRNTWSCRSVAAHVFCFPHLFMYLQAIHISRFSEGHPSSFTLASAIHGNCPSHHHPSVVCPMSLPHRLAFLHFLLFLFLIHPDTFGQLWSCPNLPPSVLYVILPPHNVSLYPLSVCTSGILISSPLTFRVLAALLTGLLSHSGFRRYHQ